jgi:ribosomal subunit interface protein
VDVVIAYGRKIVSDEERSRCEEKVAHLGQLCPGLDRAEVHFKEEHSRRIDDREWCEVTLTGHGLVFRAHATARSPLAAVDLVVEKLGHQLHRTKGRIVERSIPRHRPSRENARMYLRVRTA